MLTTPDAIARHGRMTMNLYSPLNSILPLLVCASSCAVAWEHDPTACQQTAGPPPAAARGEVTGPMSSFARMATGERRRPALTRANLFDTWHWGPGKHSMLSLTRGSGAEGEPWRELQVYYWHPGRKQVCLLGVSPFARGVSEGTIQFEGETAQAVFDIHQTGGRRELCLRWTFDGPDSYHSMLLEDSGAGFAPLAEWDYVRLEALTPSPPPSAEETPRPSEHLQPLESLLGKTWAAEGVWADGAAVQVETELEWVPYANAIHARVLAPTKEGGPLHMLDAYIYHHTGANAVRCLALSNRGGVYEGDLSVLDGGALQLDLKGYEEDHVVQHVVRLDLGQDGATRNRIWSLAGQQLRTLLLDVQHQEVEPD